MTPKIAYFLTRRCCDDGQEIGRLQGRATNQTTVDVRLRQQLRRVGRIHAAAVQNLHAIGVLGGGSGNLSLGKLLTRRLTVTGSTLRARTPAEKGRIAVALRERVWPLLESGRVAPVIQATLPLQDAARAHEMLEANQSMGKIVLVVEPQL